MSDISFIVGKPVGDKYPSSVNLSLENKNISLDDAWVNYCHEMLGQFIDSEGENLLNRTLSIALDNNVIAPKTYLTYRIITVNDQSHKLPVLMLLSHYCKEQETGRDVQITNEAIGYLSAYLCDILKVGSVETELTKPITDKSIFSNAEEWRSHLFDKNIHDCFNAFKNAIENENEFSVVFLIDTKDEIGSILAKALNGGNEITDYNTYIGTASFETLKKIINILEKRNGFDLRETKLISISEYRSLVAVIAADGISFFEVEI
jgi:hypothetical protein